MEEHRVALVYRDRLPDRLELHVATGVIVLQQAAIGVRPPRSGIDVHATSVVPDGERVGMRHIAVRTPDGFVSTAEVEEARRHVAELDFFYAPFSVGAADQTRIYEEVVSAPLEETRGWNDAAIT